MDGADDHEVAVQAFNDIVSKGSMRTLKHGYWLGDEVRVCIPACVSTHACVYTYVGCTVRNASICVCCS